MRFINFNNAGSSKPYQEVNQEIRKYLVAEQSLGGYYAAKKFEKKLDKFYINLSKLINCNKNEISFLQSSTVAWNLFLNSINIQSNNNIVILDNEYGSNLIFYINKEIKTKVVKINDSGEIDLNELKKKIDKDTKCVCICHIASQCGNILPVEKIGRIIKKINPDIFYIVDACQSIGQINVDVKKIKCDVLVGSGRKYLRGPRGTGFIFLNNKIRKKINPLFLDMNNAKFNSDNLRVSNRRIFENFEYSPALKVGLSKAVEKLNAFGINKSENIVKKKSIYLRDKLEGFQSIKFFENLNYISGINTFQVGNIKANEVYKLLHSNKFLCSISSFETSPLYFRKRKINSLVRISLHEYNKFTEIDRLVKCLIDLIKK
ncbi:MAG: aminotransferase class V-fold PLP-dependent enzyme [Alphaproteobacteria bacterium]